MFDSSQASGTSPSHRQKKLVRVFGPHVSPAPFRAAPKHIPTAYRGKAKLTIRSANSVRQDLRLCCKEQHQRPGGCSEESAYGGQQDQVQPRNELDGGRCSSWLQRTEILPHECRGRACQSSCRQ
jgi:hypothetical protein